MTSSTDVIEDQTEAQTPDWGILENERVMGVLDLAVRHVAPKVDGVFQADDLHQEASIICATKADKVIAYLADEHLGERGLFRWLTHRLMDATGTQVARSNRSIPLQVLAERAGE